MSAFRPSLKLALAMFAALGLGFGVYTWLDSGDDDAPRFETVEVDRGLVLARVTASGTVSPLVSVEVGSQVSGRIRELHADFNSRVKRGQVIATLDPEGLEFASPWGWVLFLPRWYKAKWKNLSFASNHREAIKRKK